jgi:hypothetical protein
VELIALTVVAFVTGFGITLGVVAAVTATSWTVSQLLPAPTAVSWA